MLSLGLEHAHACQPLPQDQYSHSGEKVKEKFDRVDSVELMTLISEKRVQVNRRGSGMSYTTTRATFRVVKTFKGEAKPGDIILFDSSSNCARSAVWPNYFVPPGTNIKKKKHPREWLIYRIAKYQDPHYEQEMPPHPANEITDSPTTQSIDEAREEIPHLEALKKNEETKRKHLDKEVSPIKNHLEPKS